MIWRVILHRVILWLVGVIILLPLTAYATARKLTRLPFGLDPLFGCQEDGWNGNGIDPDNPRQGWEEGVKGVWVEEKDRDPNKKYQGWWPDYKGWKWSEMGFVKRWFASYRWLLRNLCWNLRLTDWFATSIHYDDITLIYVKHDTETGEMTIEWRNNKNGKEYSFRRKMLFGKLWEFGWEFYPTVFDPDHQDHTRVREHGYTRLWKYKHRSIPSIRPRRG